MSFQAYLDNIKAKTGKTPEDFRALAKRAGILTPDLKASELVAWLKKEFDLGHGHAMAIWAVFTANSWATPPSKRTATKKARRPILSALVVTAVSCGMAGSTSAGQAAVPPTHQGHEPHQTGHGSMSTPPAHDHCAPALAVTYAELQRTVEQLAAARDATAKYQDVRVAESDGYRRIGPNVAGMGLHYVRKQRPGAFSITDPPILLYERDTAAPNGMRLTGVSYLFVAPSGADGQPADSPFPKALAQWHKHNNVCVLPDNSATVDLANAQCAAQGGRFTAETSWMVHAWIWKDSPNGVFSPTNPVVK